MFVGTMDNEYRVFRSSSAVRIGGRFSARFSATTLPLLVVGGHTIRDLNRSYIRRHIIQRIGGRLGVAKPVMLIGGTGLMAVVQKPGTQAGRWHGVGNGHNRC